MSESKIIFIDPGFPFVYATQLSILTVLFKRSVVQVKLYVSHPATPKHLTFEELNNT